MEILIPSIGISSTNIYMDMDSQQEFYRPLTKVYPVDAHQGYPS